MIAESAVHSYLRDGYFSIAQQCTGVIQPFADDVIRRCRMIIPGENTEELALREIGQIGQLLQRNRLQEMLLDISNCLPDPQRFVLRPAAVLPVIS